MKSAVLDVTVIFNGPAVRLSDDSVLMIPFRGTVTGPIFTGIVEPCGVDTQSTDEHGARRMSARYMLTGKDDAGNPCYIYVENEGFFENGQVTMPFRTTPTFRTDSPRLKKYLEQGRFYGEGCHEDGELHIKFYEET